MHHRVLTLYSITKLSKLQYSLTSRHLQSTIMFLVAANVLHFHNWHVMGEGNNMFVSADYFERSGNSHCQPANLSKVTRGWDGHNMRWTTALRVAYITIANFRSRIYVSNCSHFIQILLSSYLIEWHASQKNRLSPVVYKKKKQQTKWRISDMRWNMENHYTIYCMPFKCLRGPD